MYTYNILVAWNVALASEARGKSLGIAIFTDIMSRNLHIGTHLQTTRFQQNMNSLYRVSDVLYKISNDWVTGKYVMGKRV